MSAGFHRVVRIHAFGVGVGCFCSFIDALVGLGKCFEGSGTGGRGGMRTGESDGGGGSVNVDSFVYVLFVVRGL